jgi:hypothetical protein
MKICPVCDTKFDEEIIRFCTKDGSPLVEESQPNFVEMPSESLASAEDDIGEITVIRKKDPVPLAPPPIDDIDKPAERLASERITIPTTGPGEREQQVRQRTAPAYYPPPPESNTLKVVALTVFGTIVVLGLGAGLFWLLQKDKPSNFNVNTNLGSFNGNLNQNTNLNSFNFNTNGNFNSNSSTNLNLNMNMKSPTPTPKPSPSASPSPSPSPSPTPTMRPSPNNRPTPGPTPRMGPRPTPNPNHPPGNDE